MRTRSFAVLLLVVGVGVGPSWGIPVLQLYVEGAAYDDVSDTWVATDGGTVRLWAIGNTDGPGTHGSIYDVRLAIAYIPIDGLTIDLDPSTTGGYGGFSDPSTPADPIYIQTVTDGSVPQLSDGSDLPDHGIYNLPGIEWQEFLLGNFTLNDSPVGDFIDDFPTTLFPDSAQINVYTLDLAGAEWFHFDLYDNIQSPVQAVFAPFSHDAETGPPVPEPGTIALVGVGGLVLAALRRRKSD